MDHARCKKTRKSSARLTVEKKGKKVVKTNWNDLRSWETIRQSLPETDSMPASTVIELKTRTGGRTIERTDSAEADRRLLRSAGVTGGGRDAACAVVVAFLLAIHHRPPCARCPHDGGRRLGDAGRPRDGCAWFGWTATGVYTRADFPLWKQRWRRRAYNIPSLERRRGRRPLRRALLRRFTYDHRHTADPRLTHPRESTRARNVHHCRRQPTHPSPTRWQFLVSFYTHSDAMRRSRGQRVVVAI